MIKATHFTHSKMSRRQFLRLSVITTGSIALAACTVPVAAPSGGAAAGNTAKQPVELRWWVNPFTDDDVTKVWEPLTKKFYDAGHSDIQVKTEVMPWTDRRQKMMTAYAGGRAADVSCMNVDMVWNFASAGALAPLDDYVAKEIYSDTPESLTQLCQLEGKLYMIPYNTGPFGRIYNLQMMKDVGWDSDNPPKTWDDLRKLGPMAEKAGYYSVLEEVNGDQWIYTNWQNDGRVLLEDDAGNILGSAIDSQEVRGTWTFFKEHYDNKWSPLEFVTMQSNAQLPDYFVAEKMVISLRYSAQGASNAISQANKDLTYKALPIPFSNKQPATGSSDGSVTMYSTCKDFAAGGKWLSFVMTPDILAEWANLGGYIPSRKAARESKVWQPTDLVRQYGELTPYVRTNKDRYFYFNPGLQTILPELHAYILGNKSLDEAITTAHTAFDKFIKEDLAKQKKG